MTSLDLTTLRTGYRAGDFGPEGIVEDVLDRISAHDDPAVWIHRVSDADLRASAAALAQMPIDDLPLYGVPFAVKDNIDVAGLSARPTGCAATRSIRPVCLAGRARVRRWRSQPGW